MVCDDFSEFKEYSGHWYTITAHKMTWSAANQAAKNAGGYLAVPNNAGENSFLASNYGDSWIGVYDPNYTQNDCLLNGNTNCGVFKPDRFKTVKGSLSYTNWYEGEPNNNIKEDDKDSNGQERVTPLGEHWVALARNGTWYDDGNHYADVGGNPVTHKAIFEFNSKPECIQGEDSAETNIRMCTENIRNIGTMSNELQITDPDLLISPASSITHECLKDARGNEYCPAQLAQCGEEWDYYDGESVKHTKWGIHYRTETCPSGTVQEGDYCVSYGKFQCDGVYHNLGEDHPYIMKNWKPSGTFYEYAGVQLRAYIKFVCATQSSVKFEQCHRWGNQVACGPLTIFNAVNLAKSNNYSQCISMDNDTVEGYGSYHYSVPKKQFTEEGELETLKSVWMDGFTDFCITKTNNKNIQISVNNTYDGYGWTTRDVISIKDKIQEKKSICTDGYTPTSSTDRSKGNCQKKVQYAYYEYVCKNGLNSQGYNWQPIKKGTDCKGSSTVCNSSTPPKNNCKREKYMCKVARDRPCALVNNEWKCSPYPCHDSLGTSTDTKSGHTDSKNQGFNDDGSCSGQIRLFNGTDRRCVSWTIAGSLGKRCCADENGLLSFVMQCDAEEKELAKYLKKNKKQAHEIGEYCAEEWDLLVATICVRRKRTFCTFGSVLSRIINEQGRPQIGRGWGDPKEPDCKGFTPEEFQKLDFDKIDLSEFTNDIMEKVSENIANKLTGELPNLIQNKVDAMYNNSSVRK